MGRELKAKKVDSPSGIALETAGERAKLWNRQRLRMFPMKSLRPTVTEAVCGLPYRLTRLWAAKKAAGELNLYRVGIGGFLIVPWFALSWLGEDSDIWRLAYVFFILMPLCAAAAGVALHHYLRANAETGGEVNLPGAGNDSVAPVTR